MESNEQNLITELMGEIDFSCLSKSGTGKKPVNILGLFLNKLEKD
jgi:hypothetical protein